MGTEVENASSNVQTTATTPSSVALSGTKTSIFAKKSGFVIPKNKLSGSLVPVFRGTKKGDADLGNEDTSNQVQRKTKWGPDLTLDTTVRKGRALAYQTRADQISQQQTLGTLELEDSVESQAAPDHQLSKEELEALELEKREIIGELLKLNPTYKAPADYKPLLKEAKVPIPIKEHPEYNFIGLVFGSSSDTLKRLEKETGAKIRVYGIKADTGGKVEFTPGDGKGENAYENLYVHVTADMFEKVDAAVALIELLVTPVSVNPASSSTSTVSADVSNITGLSQSTAGPITSPPVMNQGITQLFTPSLTTSQGQFPQFPQQWFPAASQPPAYPQVGINTPTSSAVSIASNTAQAPPMPFKPPSMPPLFGSHPTNAPNFTPYPQQAPSPIPRNTNSLPGPLHNVRIPISAPPQPSPTEPVRWMPPPVGGSAPQGPVLHGLRPVAHPNNMIAPLSGASQSGGQAPSQQPHGVFSSGIHPSPIGPQHAMSQVTNRAPSFNALPSPAPRPFPGQVQPGNAPRPQQPSSGDFTYQPHRPPPQIWSSNQHPQHNIRPPQAQGGLGPMAPQPPFIPFPHQGFPSPQMSNQVNQSRPQIPPNFAGNPPNSMVPPRHPTLPGPNPMQLRNFASTHPHPHPINNSSGPFPPRPGSQIHILENRPQRLPVPNQHFGRPFSNTQQVYDPFSAAPFNPQMSINAARAQSENDPEYEDLMASVGVK